MASNRSNSHSRCSSNGDAESLKPTGLTSSASMKLRRKSATISKVTSDVDDVINLLHGSDPVRIELNRLENDVRDKERELGDAHAEIKALKYSERLKEKAVEELTDELKKVDKKLKASELLLETKNLEIKKINDEKKSALAAQFAAEGTLRRVHANQRDDEMPPIEAIITPLEAELKLTRFEVAKLQEDNRAMDRLTKSKEAALLEAERTIQMALAKAAMVDDLQNKNQDLMKQIEICQEENRILDKMHRQKVTEVEDLTQTVRELEETVLAGGAAANAVRDYQRKVQEMNDERRVLDRELARAKVSANRVATVVANEWKDSNDKVMPVKQWLDERRFFQGEMQQLRDKLAVAERTSKAEAQLKEKYLLRFKVLEEKLKPNLNGVSRTPTAERRSISSGRARRQSIGGVELSRQSSNSSLLKRSNSQSGSRTHASSTLLKYGNAPSSSFDGGNNSPAAKAPEKDEDEPASLGNQFRSSEMVYFRESNGNDNRTKTDNEDFVSGMLYDMLQKEVVTLRKACHEKDQSLKDKDDAIEMLSKKVETLNKAMEVEAKKMRREMTAMGKEITSMRITSKEQDPRGLRNGAIRGQQNGSQSHLRRNA